MELALNLVWLCVAIVGLKLLCRSLSRAEALSDRPPNHWRKIVAMSCALVILFFCCSPPSFVLFLLRRPREGSWSLHKSCMLLRSIAIGSAGERRLPRSPEPARLPLTKGVRGE